MSKHCIRIFFCKIQFTTIKTTFCEQLEYIMRMKTIEIYPITVNPYFQILYWEFTYLLKFICNPQINTQGVFRSFLDTHKAEKKWGTWHTQARRRSHRAMVCPVILTHIVNKHPFVVYVQSCFSHFCGLHWCLFYLKTHVLAPRCGAEVSVVFLNSGRLCCALWRGVCGTSFTRRKWQCCWLWAQC